MHAAKDASGCENAEDEQDQDHAEKNFARRERALLRRIPSVAAAG